MSVSVGSEPPDDWDAFVRDADDASFCHLAGWGEVFRDALGLEPRFFEARAGGKLIGGMPAYRMPRLFVGTALVSVPYLNYGGPLGPATVRETLLAEAVTEAGRARDHFIEIRSRGPRGSDLMPAGREKVTVVLPLPDDPTTLFEDRFRSKLRSQIRRPMKEGMDVRFGPDQREPFYEVFARNMRDLGTPVLPVRLFDRIAEAFPGLVRFGVVYSGGVPVSGGCGFRWKDEFEMTWASSLREYARLAPNMLLYWSFMERSIEEGVRLFNFGRCTPGGGTHRFKSQWGGEDEALNWVQWPAAANAPDASAGLFALATSVWTRLPLTLANRLGPAVARRLPTF